MKYIIALLLTLAGFGSTLASAQDVVTSTVPFDFVIGNQTFHAGKYSIRPSSNDSLRGPLALRSADGKITSFFTPTTAESTQTDGAKLVFTHEGGKYFLTEIVGASDVYTLAPSAHHEAANDQDVTVSVSTP